MQLSKSHLRALSQILETNERDGAETAFSKVWQDKAGKALDNVDDATRSVLFTVAEAFATKSQAKAIATHPLRPANVDARVDALKAEIAARKEDAKAEKADTADKPKKPTDPAS